MSRSTTNYGTKPTATTTLYVHGCLQRRVYRICLTFCIVSQQKRLSLFRGETTLILKLWGEYLDHVFACPSQHFPLQSSSPRRFKYLRSFLCKQHPEKDFRWVLFQWGIHVQLFNTRDFILQCHTKKIRRRVSYNGCATEDEKETW